MDISSEEETCWDKAQVCAFFGGSKPMNPATLYRGINEGRFPKPFHPTPGMSRWVPAECRAAMAAMITARDAAEDVRS